MSKPGVQEFTRNAGGSKTASRRWLPIVWSLGWALSLSLLALLAVHAAEHGPRFDDSVEDVPKPGEEPPDVEVALARAQSDAYRVRGDEGIVFAVCRREESPGSYRLGLLNRSARADCFAGEVEEPSAVGERLNRESGSWDFCGFSRCGTSVLERGRHCEPLRIAPNDLLDLKVVVDPKTFGPREWIRFRLYLLRSEDVFRSPFEIVTPPILARAK